VRPASQAERARLNDTFAALCRIPSPFGRERACFDHVAGELRRLGVEVTEDGAAAAAGAECGNLHARIEARPRPGGDGQAPARTILLCAHLDTVSVDGPIEPVIVDGGWENEHDAILGADNKAAIAVMLEVVRRVRVEGSPVGIELLFTVSEENGLAGAKQVERGTLRSEFGYVFDHASPIGEVVVAAPTYYRIGADFHGKAAHAGIRPEDGRSAIVAAAQAIAAMPLGRVDAETTANVGSIHGGVGSTNVVAERCAVLAEARSLDADKAETTVARIVDAFTDGAAAAECDVDLSVEKLFTGYRLRPSAPVVAAAEAALHASGYDPRRIATGGASDANALEAIGIPCVNLANGTERNHEPTERVSVAALEGMLDVALALLDAAAAA
jgi:tripeptide aminopeptidase